MDNKQVSAAFVKAQKQFSPALKMSTNPHFKSKYAGLDACIEAVIEALNESGLALIQKTHTCESGVSVETVFVHESGEQISGGVFSIPATKNDAQGYGSALTYARRYSLMAACGIAPEDDDGNAAVTAQNKKVESDYLAATNGIKAAVSASNLQHHYEAAFALFPHRNEDLMKIASARKAELKAVNNTNTKDVA
jgi:predicted RecA/RadA family phage recombinase